MRVAILLRILLRRSHGNEPLSPQNRIYAYTAARNVGLFFIFIAIVYYDDTNELIYRVTAIGTSPGSAEGSRSWPREIRRRLQTSNGALKNKNTPAHGC